MHTGSTETPGPLIDTLPFVPPASMPSYFCHHFHDSGERLTSPWKGEHEPARAKAAPQDAAHGCDSRLVPQEAGVAAYVREFLEPPA